MIDNFVVVEFLCCLVGLLEEPNGFKTTLIKKPHCDAFVPPCCFRHSQKTLGTDAGQACQLILPY